MKPKLHHSVAELEELEQLEGKLIGARRRYRRLVGTWVVFCAFMLFVAVQTSDSSSGGAPPEPLILVLATGIAIALRSATVLIAQPRVLAAQRELLGQRAPDATSSLAELGEAVEASIDRLKRHTAALSSPRPELAEALDSAAKDFRRRLRSSAADAVRAARQDLAATEETEASSKRLDAELRARLETYRLQLAGLEIDILLDPDTLSERALEVIGESRRLMTTKTASNR